MYRIKYLQEKGNCIKIQFVYYHGKLTQSLISMFSGATTVHHGALCVAKLVTGAGSPEQGVHPPPPTHTPPPPPPHPPTLLTFKIVPAPLIHRYSFNIISVSHNINSPIHPLLYFNNQEVCSAAHHKHLGLILDSKLTVAKHISQKISIARIGIIKYMTSYAPTKTLDQIYKLFVRPHMDYCDIIYHLPRSTSAFDCPINLNFMIQSWKRVLISVFLLFTVI